MNPRAEGRSGEFNLVCHRLKLFEGTEGRAGPGDAVKIRQRNTLRQKFPFARRQNEIFEFAEFRIPLRIQCSPVNLTEAHAAMRHQLFLRRRWSTVDDQDASSQRMSLHGR